MKRNSAFATYTVLSVLNKYPEEAYPSKIAGVLGINKSNALRRFTSMEKAGLIKKTLRSTTNFYTITPQGKEWLVLTGRVFKNATSRGVFRWHNLLFRLPVVEGSIDKASLCASGWVVRKRGFVSGLEKDFKTARVFFAGSSFLVFPKPILEVSLFKAMDRGLGLAERIAGSLERVLPVKLHSRAEVCRQQMAFKGGFTKWIPEGFNFVGDVLIVDFSTGEAEIETYGQLGFEAMMRLASFWDEVGKGNIVFETPLRKEVF